MKKPRLIPLLITLLLVLTALAAAVHFATRAPALEGYVRVETADAQIQVPLAQLPLAQVQGEARNNKGDVWQVDAQGCPLQALLSAAQVQLTASMEVTVTADDGYSASLSGAEVLAEGKVYLLLDEDVPRLMVFGDSGSKRNVSGVVAVSVT